jgi:hypothetical protein
MKDKEKPKAQLINELEKLYLASGAKIPPCGIFFLTYVLEKIIVLQLGIFLSIIYLSKPGADSLF